MTEKSKSGYSLTSEQQRIFDFQLFEPKVTIYNFSKMLCFDKKTVEPERFVIALNEAVRNHPALKMGLSFNDDNDLVQQEKDYFPTPAIVEKISEPQLAAIRDDLDRPFVLINSPLCRLHVFETQSHVYFYLGAHRIIFDDASFDVLLDDLSRSLRGETLGRDSYCSFLAAQEEAFLSPEGKEDIRYFSRLYSDFPESCPKKDMAANGPSEEDAAGELTEPLKFTRRALDLIETKLKLDRESFFLLVSALVTAFYNKQDNLRIAWEKDCHENAETIGQYCRTLPFALRLADDMTVYQLCRQTSDRVREIPEHRCIPPTETVDILRVVYQKKQAERPLPFGGNEVELELCERSAANLLSFIVSDSDDKISICLDFDASNYTGNTIIKLSDLFSDIVVHLLLYANEDTTVAELREMITVLQE